MKVNGSATDGALAPKGGLGATGRALTLADVGDEAAIGLFLGLGGETAFFEHRIQMDRPAVGMGAQLRASGQCAQRLQYVHHWLRRFESPRVQFKDRSGFGFRATAAAWGRARQILNRSRFFPIARKQNFPVATGILLRLVAEALFGQNVIERHRLEWRDEQQVLRGRQARDRRGDLCERLAAVANIVPHIKGYRGFRHKHFSWVWRGSGAWRIVWSP